MSTRHDIAITLGDPSGIGPEIVAQVVADCDAGQRARLRIIGDRSVLGDDWPADVRVDDAALLTREQVTAGRPNDATARAQVAYLEAAVLAARAGEIAGLVTAPISKTQAVRAGFAFPGHTEFLAARLGAKDVAMMFAGPRFRVVLVTVHQALAEVGKTLSAELVGQRISMFGRALLRDFGCTSPKVGVLGFNPHAGEDGMFGDEEARAIVPGIVLARAALPGTFELVGPLIPDVAFRAALHESYDGLVAMYHDQALIPVKLLDFDDTVNVTLGLPIVRTSPDHGTAYDIAGSGRARANSFAAALRLAFELVDRRVASTTSQSRTAL